MLPNTHPPNTKEESQALVYTKNDPKCLETNRKFTDF